MSISAMFGTAVIALHPTKAFSRAGGGGGGGGGKAAAAIIECSSRPTKKATSHHMKTRPRKSQPWDIKRGPTVYPPLPPLPPEWTFVSRPADSSDASPPPPTEEGSSRP